MISNRYYVYILQSQKTGNYYVGSTQDVGRRFRKHQNGLSMATRGKGPWFLVHVEEFEIKTSALKREFEIKSKKSRDFIRKIIYGAEKISMSGS